MQFIAPKSLMDVKLCFNLIHSWKVLGFVTTFYWHRARDNVLKGHPHLSYGGRRGDWFTFCLLPLLALSVLRERRSKLWRRDSLLRVPRTTAALEMDDDLDSPAGCWTLWWLLDGRLPLENIPLVRLLRALLGSTELGLLLDTVALLEVLPLRDDDRIFSESTWK